MDFGIKRFITFHIPVYSCNFNCSYCYVGHNHKIYTKAIDSFIITPKEIADFFSVERTGGYCYFNLCGLGETLFHPQLTDLVSCLTIQGHFCDIITNGILTNKLECLITTLNDFQKKHLFIKFSFHYLELKFKNLLSTFIKNIELIKNAGISFSIELTPHDELIPYIDELKEFSLEHFNTLPHLTVARNENTSDIALLSSMDKSDYKNTWSSFNSPLFDFKLRIFNEKRKEFCYAGRNSLYVNLKTGEYKQCYCGKVLGNIKNSNRKIHFSPIGKCLEPHCFNGHAFLAFGNIPELSTPTYAEERDRATSDGNWLNQDCFKFFSTKTYELNKGLTKNQKCILLAINAIMKPITRINSYLKRHFQWTKNEN